ncbi:hypothetical protein TSAR_003969 [Trichomalopsis sarcophagae]|uniref:Uncharacterized protein n=1 Tax=Trichomalopsis sarcophagae TaxID=543379 RepID=A0A232F7B5_9HYME|nr:hypothetical protein TSAR_003969 [Trichomalopsis sarcophagae]
MGCASSRGSVLPFRLQAKSDAGRGLPRPGIRPANMLSETPLGFREYSSHLAAARGTSGASHAALSGWLRVSRGMCERACSGRQNYLAFSLLAKVPRTSTPSYLRARISLCPEDKVGSKRASKYNIILMTNATDCYKSSSRIGVARL